MDQVTIHWMMPHPDGLICSAGITPLTEGGRYAIACKPQQAHTAGLFASGEKHVVNCILCRQHPAYGGQIVLPVVAEAEIGEETLALFQPKEK